MEALLGSSLLTKSGPAGTAAALGDAGVIGLYFSAHWCPPCRGFTPVLGKKYEELRKAGKAVEIVFVSSDKNQAEFDEYYGEQPWLALPFEARDAKAALSKKFKVQGIPTLVLLNADGSVITKDGREGIMEGEYPFTPPTAADVLPDDLAVATKDGPETLGAVRARTTNLGLYFSAHWCPPCKRFTPQLASLYKAVQARGEKFEVVFVSSDRSESDFDAYWGDMPWAALPFSERAAKEKLSSFFGVEGIPTFVVLDSATLDVVNPNARAAVQDKTGEKYPWAPPAAANIDESPDGVNETACVVALFEEAPDDWDDVTAALTEVGAEVRAECKAKKEDQDVLFKYAEENGGIGAKVRELAKLKAPADGKVEVVLLNIPDENYHVANPAPVDAAGLRKLVADFRASALAMTPLGQ